MNSIASPSRITPPSDPPFARPHRAQWRIFSCSLIIPLFALALRAAATTYYADAEDGDNAYDGLAAVWDNTHGPKATIQAAINAASSGDTVIAATGTYYECPPDQGGRADCRQRDLRRPWPRRHGDQRPGRDGDEYL